MNKKLFSWKALAGLALLVAMGLTSCKQDNPVTLDSDGNYVLPPKPVTPTAKGTTLSGFKTVAELNTLIAGTKDITDNIAADKSVTINLDCSNLEAAAGDKIVIPGKTDATIELVFTNKAKKNEGLVITDDALDVVKVTFPEGEFGNVSFEMPYSTLTVASAGASTLGNVAFNVNKNNRTEFVATIESGITINSIKTWYVDANKVFQWSGSILTKEGAVINALTVDKELFDYFGSYNNGENGYEVGSVYTDIKDWKNYYVKSLNVVANNVSVGAFERNDKVVVEKITIAEGDTVTINGGAANEIVGAGKGAVLTNFNAGYAAKYSNLTINGNGWSYNPNKATLEKCTLVDFRSIYLTQASAKELKFKFEKYNGDNTSSLITSIYYPVTAAASDASFAYPFESCEFVNNVKVNAYSDGVNVLDKDGNPIKQTLYAWDKYNAALGYWETQASGLEKLTDVPDTVRMGNTKTPTSWWSYEYEPKYYPFTNLSLIPSFKSCKYSDAAVSAKNVGNFLNYTSLYGADSKEVATTTQVKIDDKLYKRVYTKNNGWILVEQ